MAASRHKEKATNSGVRESFSGARESFVKIVVSTGNCVPEETACDTCLKYSTRQIVATRTPVINIKIRLCFLIIGELINKNSATGGSAGYIMMGTVYRFTRMRPE